MLTSSNTLALSVQQSPATGLQLPTDPTLPWPDYLDRVANLIQDAYRGDPRAWFVAAQVREAATVAHLHGLRSHFEHYQWLLDVESDPEPESGPAAPITQGCLAGRAAQWDPDFDEAYGAEDLR